MAATPREKMPSHERNAFPAHPNHRSLTPERLALRSAAGQKRLKPSIQHHGSDFEMAGGPSSNPRRAAQPVRSTSVTRAVSTPGWAPTPFDYATVSRTPGISCEAVPASMPLAGAGMRRHLRPSAACGAGGAAESFVSFIPLFGGPRLRSRPVAVMPRRSRVPIAHATPPSRLSTAMRTCDARRRWRQPARRRQRSVCSPTALRRRQARSPRTARQRHRGSRRRARARSTAERELVADDAASSASCRRRADARRDVARASVQPTAIAPSSLSATLQRRRARRVAALRATAPSASYARRPRGRCHRRSRHGPPNTGDKLRSGARVRPRRRGHSAAPPAERRLRREGWCRRKLRQLHPLVRRRAAAQSFGVSPVAARCRPASAPEHSRHGRARRRRPARPRPASLRPRLTLDGPSAAIQCRANALRTSARPACHAARRSTPQQQRPCAVETTASSTLAIAARRQSSTLAAVPRRPATAPQRERRQRSRTSAIRRRHRARCDLDARTSRAACRDRAGDPAGHALASRHRSAEHRG